MENALCNVYSFRIIIGFYKTFQSKSASFNLSGRQQLTKSVVFAPTLISSESLKLDTGKSLNLH